VKFNWLHNFKYKCVLSYCMSCVIVQLCEFEYKCRFGYVLDCVVWGLGSLEPDLEC